MTAWFDPRWDYLWDMQMLWFMLLPFVLIFSVVAAGVERVKDWFKRERHDQAATENEETP